MKLKRTALAVAIASALAFSLSACSNTGSNNQTPAAQPPTSAAPTSSMAATSSAMATAPTSAAAMPAAAGSMASTYGTASTNWFGGPIYSGKPALKATAALVKAGGGAKDFKFSTALVAMLGQKTVNAEVAKLTKQYGKKNVDDFISGMTFTVKDGLKRATQQGVKLPEAPADLTGTKLAKALVDAGTAPGGAFWAGYLFDKALSHPVHVAVMADIDSKEGHAADGNVHKILNQAMYDVAQALGEKDVKLAAFH